VALLAVAAAPPDPLPVPEPVVASPEPVDGPPIAAVVAA